MHALVIGADGFVGRWLLRHLTSVGDEVTAAVGPRFRGEALPAGLPAQHLDVRDRVAVEQLVASADPGVVYFLPALSRAGARDEIRDAVDVSICGAMNVLIALSDSDRSPLLLHVGSSHVYGPSPGGTPLDEEAPVRPATVYGAVKAAAETALLSLGGTLSVGVVAIRPFNHSGPGQGEAFVIPSLAHQVVSIAKGAQEPVIRAGNLEVERDFTDVRDVVRAYRLLAEHARPGEVYNVASGIAVSVRTIAEHLAGIAGVTVAVVSDPALTRSDQPSRVMGDSRRLQRATGWRPEISLEQTLRDTLDAIATGVANGP